MYVVLSENKMVILYNYIIIIIDIFGDHKNKNIYNNNNNNPWFLKKILIIIINKEVIESIINV